MKHTLKVLFSLLFVIAAISLVAIHCVDTVTLSNIVGFDITNCSYLGGENVTYRFSLIDSKVYISIALAISALAFIGAMVATDIFVSHLKMLACWAKNYATDSFRLLKKTDLKYLLAILLVAYCYFAYTQPVTFDEVWTYNLFLSRPLGECMFLYPIPNNHILYSILGNITTTIPIFDLLFKMRLAAILVSLLTWIVAYRFVAKYYGNHVALVVVSLASVASVTLLFGFLARGYGLVYFFTVFCLYAAFNIVKGDNRQRDWFALALGGILGAYAMPSFLYPFATINLYVLFYKYQEFGKQFFWNIVVGIGVFILYLPIIVVCGLGALTNNEFVKPIAHLTVLKSLPGFVLGTMGNIFTMSPYIICVIVLALLIFAIKKKDKETLILWMLFGVAPAVLLLAHSVIPFFRTFSYYGFIIVFLTAVTMRQHIMLISSNMLLGTCLVIQLVGIAYFNYRANYLLDTLSGYRGVQEMVEDKKKYCIENGKDLSLLYQSFVFEGKRRGYNIDVEMRYGFADADSIQGFDYYIVQQEVDSTRHQPSFAIDGPRLETVNVYRYTNKLEE